MPPCTKSTLKRNIIVNISCITSLGPDNTVSKFTNTLHLPPHNSTESVHVCICTVHMRVIGREDLTVKEAQTSPFPFGSQEKIFWNNKVTSNEVTNIEFQRIIKKWLGQGIALLHEYAYVVVSYLPTALLKCCGCGSCGSTCFWASWIRIHQSEVWIRNRILLS